MAADGQESGFIISVDDFDKSLLPPHARTPGSDAFQQEVRRFFEKEYADFGGWVRIVVDEKIIQVWWRQDPKRPDPLDTAISALKKGDYEKGVRLLEVLRRQQPDNNDILYNLGMALSDLGRLDEALTHLKHASVIAPERVNTLVAIGVVLARQGKSTDAIPVLKKALAKEPDNPWANRNLGACLLKIGQKAEAEKILRRAVELNPSDQQSLLGLAEALRANDNIEEADKFYVQVIKLDERSPILPQPAGNCQGREYLCDGRTSLSRE